MRHRSRRPLFDTLARPRLAVGLAALCVGGAGATLVVGTSADEHTADAEGGEPGCEPRTGEGVEQGTT